MPSPPAVITLTHRLDPAVPAPIADCLWLTAEERTRSRHRFQTETGQAVFLQLSRGTALQDGDRLQSPDGFTVLVRAKPEPVLTVRADSPLQLLQAAYHLGNRHVPLEITADYLRLSPDPVLKDMLLHRGVSVQDDLQPFHPEPGAYGSHAPTHSHSHSPHPLTHSPT